MGRAERLQQPPFSLEAEQALLGALLLEPTAWTRVSQQLRAEDLFRPDHRLIFEAIATCHARNESADAVTVVAHLERLGQLDAAGGRDYIAKLLAETPSAANVRAYANRVAKESTLRRLLEYHRKGAARIYEGDPVPSQLIAEATEQLLALQAETRTGRGLVNATRIVRELIDDLDRRAEGDGGLSVGLPDFDELVGGLEPSDLVVLAGRPGMGKTALLVSIAANVSRNMDVAIFSAEMSAQQLLRRCVALLGAVPQNHLRRAQKLTEQDWANIDGAATAIGRRRLHIDDTPSPRLAHIRAETLAQCARSSLGLVLVDYVQLVHGQGANRYEQLRDVSYGLKALAKEAHLPIILLAQLNRGVERRYGDNRRGRLSDLRDSGAIEEAADVVGLLYSEGYYDSEFKMPYVLECAVEKNRHGPRGECLWHFAGEYSRVSVLEEGARIQYRRERNKNRRGAQGDDDL